MDNTITFIDAAAAAISTLAVVFALFFSLRQTALMRKSMDETNKQTRINSILASSTQYLELNNALIEQDDLRKIFGEDKEAVYIGNVFLTLETRFRLRKEGLIDSDFWRADLASIATALWLNSIQERWDKVKIEYYSSFRLFLDDYLAFIRQCQQSGMPMEDFIERYINSKQPLDPKFDPYR